MPTTRRVVVLSSPAAALAAGAALIACGGAQSGASPGASAPATAPGPGGSQAQTGPEPQHIQVQHVLVGFRGSVPGKQITRTQDEAKTLAYDILKRAQGGADFDALVKQYTDDSPPGIYGMSNKGVAPAQGEYPRENMVPAFGNVGFTLKAGGYGVADFDPRNSPYGYHVIKRLK